MSSTVLRRATRFSVPAAVAALLAACATPKGSVVLLPDAAGQGSAVTVIQNGKEVVLEQPYAGAKLASSGPQAFGSNAADVQSTFGLALAALPGRPTRFTLYFVEGKDEFSAESKLALDGVLAEIAARPVPDVLVVGHTDRVGGDPANDALSRQRAEVVRNALIARGVAPESVVSVGRGEREAVVPTADGVAEARNRRVEILVR
jgi:outer membrane protein OmpA-like peptidoglycan-associated protein